MRGLLVLVVVALVVVAGAAFLTWKGPGGGAPVGAATGAGEALTPSERALAMVREELARAGEQEETTATDWLADARAWVEANREPGWAYAELEAWRLAKAAAAAEGRAVTIRQMLDEAGHQVDVLRAMDVDGDGLLSDGEVAAYAEHQAAMADLRRHPYMIERFDNDGDGVLGPEETPWLDAGAQLRRERALAERVMADRWDSDGDGVVSEEEQGAGRAAALLRAQIFPDGHIEYVADAGPEASEAQQRVREQMAEEFGEDALELTLARQERASESFLTVDLAREMALIEIDPGQQSEPGPRMPEWQTFDRDGDGSFNEQELAAQMAAMEAWEREMAKHNATQSAERFRAMFEAEGARADRDGDGRVSASEWEAHRTRLEAARDDRLFRRHYDRDGDGRLGPGELEDFVAWYRTGSLRADADYDGRVDVEDLRLVAERFEGER